MNCHDTYNSQSNKTMPGSHSTLSEKEKKKLVLLDVLQPNMILQKYPHRHGIFPVSQGWT